MALRMTMQCAQAPPDVSALPAPERTVEVRTAHTYRGEDAANLFQMTPFYWNASEALQVREILFPY